MTTRGSLSYFYVCWVKQQLRNTAPRQNPCPKRQNASSLTAPLPLPSTRAETPLTRLDLQTCSCHCASTRTSSSSRGCGSRSAPATPSRAPARAPSVRFAHRSKATAPAARRRVPAEAAHVAQLEGPDCAVAQEEASAQDQVLVRLLADPLARVPCRPAVREVVHQLSVEGLRVRGPRGGFRSCAASAPGAAALHATHAA